MFKNSNSFTSQEIPGSDEILATTNAIFKLMHRDTVVALILVDTVFSAPKAILEIYDKDLLPFAIQEEVRKYYDGSPLQSDSLKEWFANRVIPISRKDSKRLLLAIKEDTLNSISIKHKALTIMDCYWLKHTSDTDTWGDVNFYTNNFTDEYGDILFRRLSSDKTAFNSFSPDATLTGVMTKRWMKRVGKLYLVKLDLENNNRRVINEIIATKLHEVLGFCNFVRYAYVNCSYNDKRELACACVAFTTEFIEYIPANELIDKYHNEDNDYDALVVGINKHTNIPIEEIKYHLDYMFITDYLLSNNDRHLNNFGVLRTPDGYKMAPLFDTGNSIFYNSNDKELPLLSEVDNLSSSLFMNETEIFKYVDISVVNFSLLKDFTDVIRDELFSHEYPNRIEVLSNIFKYKVERAQYGDV